MKLKLTILFILNICSSFAQVGGIDVDSIKNKLQYTNNDRDRIALALSLCLNYSTINFDSANDYGNRGLTLAEKINYNEGIVNSLCVLGIANTRYGDLAKAFTLEFKGLSIAQENHLSLQEALSYYAIGKAFYFLKDYINSINYLSKARLLFLKTAANTSLQEKYSKYELAEAENHIADCEIVLAEAFMDNKQLDSAIFYFRKLLAERPQWKHVVMIFMGDAIFRSGETQTGITYLRDEIKYELNEGDHYQAAWSASILGRFFIELNRRDSAIYYAKIGLVEAQKVRFKDRILSTANLLAKEYESIDIKQAHAYLKIAKSANDELFGPNKVIELQKTLAKAQQMQLEAEKKQEAFKNSIKLYSILTGSIVILGIAIILYRNNRQKQKANIILEKTLTDLKSTQSQLIQSEKMASLGELTAGIAHEIQNPLNFVNNFSEVSTELVAELNAEIDKGNAIDAKEIAIDLKQNLEKINHHGKRAGEIVKSMLQHSRKSGNQKELTDINAICDEYLRLAYHGYRAKDKSFNAEFKTEFDSTMPKLNVIPQDIGRVVLNLINNAFYAVNQQRTTNNEQPLVIVSTKNLGDRIEISVKDNGPGIPDSIKEKIFQPFFTTKPTGQGTGLGLSLAYDIITKGHSGNLVVESYQQEGACFILTLPIS